MIDREGKKEFFCGECEEFVLHYVKSKNEFKPLLYGDCIRKKVEKRSTFHRACEYWQPKKEEE